jgi:ribosomal protein L37AE/L43A
MKICPNCGSTRYLEDYPVVGVSICEKCGHEVTSTPVKKVDEEIEENIFSKRTCRGCGREQTGRKTTRKWVKMFEKRVSALILVS